MRQPSSGNPAAGVDRLYRATNDHDLEAIVSCFAPDYRNETPAHPQRGFTGNEQVRRNWTQILAAVPDVTAEVVRKVEDGDSVWIETEHRGTRPDGSPHLMRGVIVFGVAQDLITWARFYLEPVESGGGNVDAAVQRQLNRTAYSDRHRRWHRKTRPAGGARVEHPGPAGPRG